jgi:atypical dual specificity phosphatase
MPWTWTLNWGIITPDLIVGTCPREPADLNEIKVSTGVTAVMSLQHDECLAHYGIDFDRMSREGEAMGLTMERCPIRDFDPMETRRLLPDAVKKLAGLQAGGHRTYVHCTAGISRAPLTVFGYLALVAGVDERKAQKMIMDGRPGAVPYWEAYDGAREDLKARHRDLIERRMSQLAGDNLSLDGARVGGRAEAEVLREVLSGPDTRQDL